MGTAKQIIDRLWGPGINSDDRLQWLISETLFESSAVFWPVFMQCWSTCDATWHERDELLDMLQMHTEKEPARGYMEAAALAFLDSLPDPVTIYRGCSRERVRGLSWTTERDIAARFARGHRSIRVPDPVIATAKVRKASILAAFVDREEAELIVDPAGLANLRVRPF